ncbi:RICIN domain-containing protein [Nonomuraea candida]|uniref:RICIN domain-containing protein n=1 Tax=Nonomuraea candida TaxID=359159 RepID=UPI000A96976C|nr:RICIN domain-containing protein [Nonomuraea candida]
MALLLGIGAQPAVALTGDVAMHDPSVIKAGSCYYGYSTGTSGRGGGTISIRRTCDAGGASGWTYVGTIFNSVPAWITARLGRTPPELWAPDINYFNGMYHLYYAASYWGQQTTALMGLATAPDPAGPWTDRGEVTDINYPIDPNVFTADGTMYVMWGSWPGTYLRVLDPVTGKLSPSDTRMWRIAENIENQAMMRDGAYYYLFGSRGTCCVGTNSTYYTVVGRSTSPAGPFLDRDGVDMARGGGTTVLTGAHPQVAAGGGDPFDDGPQRMFAYHFYDANANGRGTLNIRPITFSGGWPVMGQPLGTTTPVYERISNRNSGQVLDVNASSTADGTPIIQWPWYNGASQQWTFQDAGGGHFRIVNRNSGKCLDVNGASTADGTAVIQWPCGTGANQQWQWVATGAYFQLRARHSGKCADVTGASTANAAAVIQWPCGTGANQQWTRAAW